MALCNHFDMLSGARCVNEAYERVYCAGHAVLHEGRTRMPEMLFPDPRTRPPTRRPGAIKPFLIEAHVDKRWSMNESGRRPGGATGPHFTVEQVGAFCDEDGTLDDLVIRTGQGLELGVGWSEVKFDRRYLARIWPALFTPTGDKFGCGDAQSDLIIETEGKAVVVLAGTFVEYL